MYGSHEFFRGINWYETVGLPGFVNGLDAVIVDLKRMGVTNVFGNSNNQPRQLLCAELSEKVGARYHHLTDNAAGIDELDAASHLNVFPDSLSSVGGCLTYQEYTVMSKLLRVAAFDDQNLDRIGLSKDRVDHSILLFADTIIIVDGKPMEKPRNDADALAQIVNLVGGKEYLVSNVQLAIWARMKKGMAVNGHLLPVRVDPNINDIGKQKLTEKWYEIYRSRRYPVTPGAVSQTHPEILPFLQIGMLPSLDNNVIEFYDFSRAEERIADPRWISFGDLPQNIRNEVGTTISGSSPRGNVRLLRRLIEETDRISTMFYPSRILALTRYLVNLPVEEAHVYGGVFR